MTKATRDALLEKVWQTRNLPPPAITSLDWQAISRITEGLVFGQRPIRAAARKVTEKYDLGPRGAFILSLIAGGLAYPLELATALKTGRSLITAELARLTEAGLITATPDAQDRRRSALALTRDGEAACAEVRDAIAMIIERNLAGYNAQEIALFSRMLSDVHQLSGDEAEF